MLGKLFTHELRTQGRRALTILAVCASIGLVGTGLSAIRVTGVSMFGGSVAFAAYWVAPILIAVVLLAGYWKSMYSTRGYFTFMLPARGRTIYFAKVLHIIAMCLAGIGVTALGMFLVGQTHGAQEWANHHPGDDWYHGHHDYHGRPFGGHSGHHSFDWHDADVGVGTCVLFGFLGALAVAALIIQITALMSIAARSRWSHLGFAAPVIAFIAYWVPGAFLGAAAMFYVPMGIRTSDGSWVWQGMWNDIHSWQPGDQPEVIGMGHILLYAVMTCVLAVWAVRTIERHTSLR